MIFCATCRRSHATGLRPKCELASLTALAGMDLQAVGYRFLAGKVQTREKHSISNEELRQYFPAKTVIDGLFELAGRLYGVALQQQDGVDCLARRCPLLSSYAMPMANRSAASIRTFMHGPGKRNGAWIDICVDRQSLNGNAHALPVGYLVCNFPPPDENGLSLLTHDDVVTLFHEFGHMLHHLADAH